jgi:nitrate/nitrite-specific signal transduction histidine kinase
VPLPTGNRCLTCPSPGTCCCRLPFLRPRWSRSSAAPDAWELRPPSIDEIGLKKALASYVAEWSEQCGTEADFHCDDPDFDEVPSEIGTAIYRVVQEGLTNIVKHAKGPTNVSVVIRRVGTVLHVIVEDNGCGFDVGAISKGGRERGLGLEGMRERLHAGRRHARDRIHARRRDEIFARIALESQRTAA